MLHITNGDAVVGTIRAAAPPGDVLPWRDVLHEGPVPEGLALPELSEVRASFIAGRGWAPLAEVQAAFARRDAALERSFGEDEVVLWFEHDLYDQLQLLQVLDFFAEPRASQPKLSLVCIDAFPGVERFYGLGQLSAEQVGSLFPLRTPVSDAQRALARRAWAAFRSPDPTRLAWLLASDTRALPFLWAALRRHLAQFPSTRNGLSRTHQLILDRLGEGECDPVTLFLVHQEREEAPFMGDSTFRDYIRELMEGERPLLRWAGEAPAASPLPLEPLALTEDGRAVAGGRADWIALRGGMDRWLGGVHLRGDAPAWRWDVETERLVARRGGAG